MYQKQVLARLFNKSVKELNSTPLAYFTRYGELFVNTYKYLSDVVQISSDDVSTKINRLLVKEDIHYITELHLQSFLEDNFHNYEFEIWAKDCNIYNGDSLFDDVILYSLVLIDGEFYLIYNIHIGTDVRAGYSLPRCNKVTNYIDTMPLLYGDIDGVQVTNNNGYDLVIEKSGEVFHYPKHYKDKNIELQIAY